MKFIGGTIWLCPTFQAIIKDDYLKLNKRIAVDFERWGRREYGNIVVEEYGSPPKVAQVA
jgi:hypothetical protein